MRMYDVIAKKRDGFELSAEEIAYFINGYTNGSIPDYQASALLMAIYLNGMSNKEISDLTLEMARSGEFADLSEVNGVTVDKHSTGGVGDKTTLIVVPIVAALGGKVAKMSGRGLGHTGGTVDKLESISGYKTEIPKDYFIECVNKIGASMIGQSGNLAPADKKLYALRDVTATVECIPLIASSIMSKKLASGSDCIVLDVKTGTGAFMKTLEDSERLAQQMVDIGKSANKRVSAVITNMNIPLGYAVGNSLEVIEAVQILKGQIKGDLYEVSIELSANMFMLTSGKTLEECRTLAVEVVENGKAFEKLKEIVSAQGGDTSLLDNTELFEKASYTYDILAKKSGYISKMNTEKIGIASVVLGAGRERKGELIDHSAGIILSKKTGDYAEAGDVLATLYTNKKEVLPNAEEIYLSAIEFSSSKPIEEPLIYKTVF